MESDSKIARYGNSLTVRLPVGIARELDLRAGDRVTLRTVDGGVLIECPKLTRLAAMLATVRAREAEVDTGNAVGNEVID
jgi:antitoxin component of MazEF toxin-antitoxin module